MRGKIKFWDTPKGYGFIRVDDGQNDVFAHITKVYSTDDDLQQMTPQLGDEVEFEIETNKKIGKPQATKIYIRVRGRA